MSKPHFWTLEKIALLGTDSDATIAKRLGVSPSRIFLQRSRRGIPAHKSMKRPNYKWGQTELDLLRTYTDREIAKITGRSLREIAAKRREVARDQS